MLKRSRVGSALSFEAPLYSICLVSSWRVGEDSVGGTVCLVLALPVAADAHAEIFFPKLFSVDELPYTGFVFLNPDPTLATVNFYLMSASGSTVASGVLTVGAGGQVSKLGSNLFPHP